MRRPEGGKGVGRVDGEEVLRGICACARVMVHYLHGKHAPGSNASSQGLAGESSRRLGPGKDPAGDCGAAGSDFPLKKTWYSPWKTPWCQKGPWRRAWGAAS